MEGTSGIEWDDDTFERVLGRLATDGTIDAVGVRIKPERLTRILEAAKTPDRPSLSLFRNANFAGVIFEGDANFSGVTFGGHADFSGATFSGIAAFRSATIKGQADFGGATFRHNVYFGGATLSGYADFGGTFSGFADFSGATFSAADFGATFDGDVRFDRATFDGSALFGGATFAGTAHFDKATFKRDARFDGGTFKGDAGFEGATFEWDANFDGATFGGDARFDEATFSMYAGFDKASFAGNAEFYRATFELAQSFGPVLVEGTLRLDYATFLRPIQCDCSASRVSFLRASFPAGATIQVRWAEVILEEAVFGAPSILSGSRPFKGLEEASLLLSLEESSKPLVGANPQPSLLSLRRANVGKLLLSDTDLRRCRFVRAHNLDRLRLEGDVFLSGPPKGPWWAQRRVLAEEHQWRSSHGTQRSRKGWYREQNRPPDWFQEEHPEVKNTLPGHLIANVYRDLRKGREDNKDEPGAADFYYGEMEMRRLADTTPRAERLILWLYWLVSGYGLRASRALVALAITIALGAVLLGLSGFDPGKHPDDGTLLFAAESSISLLRPPDTKNLTAIGHVVQIALRLAGPLFVGLALLSLRGRVKR